MILVPVLWILLILLGIERKKYNEPILEASQTTALKGICSIEIMLGHIGLATGNIILYPNRKAGILFVGIFLMLSGYGVAYSVEHKDNYLVHFLRKKFLRLMLPAYFAFLVGESARILFQQNMGWDILINLGYFFETLNWYVWEQLLLYVIYYFVYNIMPEKMNWIIVAISVIFVGIGFVLKIDNPWYGSVLCFAFGLIYYNYKEKVQELIYKKFWLFLFVFGVVLIFSISAFFYLGNESILGNPAARNIAAISFCILVLTILSRVKIGNHLSYYLGKCSYEIYLIHSFVISFLLGMKIESGIVFCCLTIGISIILGGIIHYILTSIFKTIIFLKR